jgi:hypothetical protein
MKTKILLVVTCFMLGMVASAFAQDIIEAKIPFQFTFGTKVLPAGTYVVNVNFDGQTVSVKSESKGGVAIKPFITLLASQMHTTPQDSHLVFDKVGETCTLSEVWLWQGDGVLVHSTKGKHEHKVINVPH